MAKTKKAAKKAKIAKKKPAAPKKAPAPKKKPAAPKKKAPAPKKKPAAPKKKAPAPKKKLAAPKKKAPAPKKAAAAPKKAAPAPKKKAAAPKKDKPAPISRRDGGGHVNEKYAAELLEKSHRSQDKDERDGAFLRGKSKNDPLADELGKEFLETATSGEDEGNEIRDELETEELGGPFVATTAAQEYDYEPDESNPKGSRREPFPNT